MIFFDIQQIHSKKLKVLRTIKNKPSLEIHHHPIRNNPTPTNNRLFYFTPKIQGKTTFNPFKDFQQFIARTQQINYPPNLNLSELIRKYQKHGFPQNLKQTQPMKQNSEKKLFKVKQQLTKLRKQMKSQDMLRLPKNRQINFKVACLREVQKSLTLNWDVDLGKQQKPLKIYPCDYSKGHRNYQLIRNSTRQAVQFLQQFKNKRILQNM